MENDNAVNDLESEIGCLLEDLASTQERLLELLQEKRALMVSGDLDGMAGIQHQEHALCDRLQACHDRRGELLAEAELRGLPSGSLRQLAQTLPDGEGSFKEQIADASTRVQLLQHESLTNWVLAQRSLLHISQMLEIIATGGKIQPTYGMEGSVSSSGALVDQQA